MKNSIVIISLLLLTIVPSYQNNQTDTPSLDVVQVIHIDGDQDFTVTASNNSWPGTGTSDDPIIIDGLQMYGSSSDTLVSIMNTNLHFIIQNSIFNGSLRGIDLAMISNGRIYNNTFTNNDHGIYSITSSNITISSNSFINNTKGILFATGNNANIENNYFYGLDNWISHGLDYVDTSNSTISGNIIVHTYEGMFIDGADEGTRVSNNTVTKSSTAIRVYNTGLGDVVLSKNSIHGNDYGMIISSSARLDITMNMIFDNDVGVNFVYGFESNFSVNMVMRNRIGVIAQLQSISGGSLSTRIFNNTVYENTETGILASLGKIVQIYHNEVMRNQEGIRLKFGVSHSVHDNNVHDNYIGITVDSTVDPIIYNEHLVNNGFFIDHYVGSLVYHHLLSFGNNTVDGLPVTYYNHTENIELTGLHGQIILVNVTNIDIHDATLTGGSYGILLNHVTNATISHSNFTGKNANGVGMWHSSNVTIVENTLDRRNHGVFGTDVANITIIRNKITDSNEGIRINDYDRLDIVNNTVSRSNRNGIYLESGVNATIMHNYIDHNGHNSTNTSLSALGTDYFADLFGDNSGVALFFIQLTVFAFNIAIGNLGYALYNTGDTQVHHNDFVDNGSPGDDKPQIISNFAEEVTDNFFHEWWEFDTTDGDGDGNADEPYIFQDTIGSEVSTTSTSTSTSTNHWLSDPKITEIVFNNDAAGTVSFDLSWIPSRDSSDHDVTYTVTIFDQNVQKMGQLEGLTQTSLTVNTLALGTGTYSVQVTAVDSVGALAFDSTSVEIINTGRGSVGSTTQVTSKPTTSTSDFSIPDDAFETTESFFLQIQPLGIFLSIITLVIFLRRKKLS